MLQNIASIGYAGGRMGLGTWAMGQVASGLATALQSIPALGLALNPATMAAAAAMFLISPSLNAVGRNIGAEMMAGVTGQGGTTPSSIFYDAITANPIFRVLSWIPFFGPRWKPPCRDTRGSCVPTSRNSSPRSSRASNRS